MQRIPSLDLARGFTVLMMAPVHSILIYSHPSVYDTWLVKCLAFIAEGPGAQLFMTLMGVYMMLSDSLNWKGVMRRSILILFAGYELNLLKFFLPNWLGLLPETLLADLQVKQSPDSTPVWIQLLRIGDIFHFAALALPLLYAIKQCKKVVGVSAAAIVVVLLASPLVWNTSNDNSNIQYLLQLLGGQPPQVFFPLFPWLVYPLVGLLIGYGLRGNSKETFTIILGAGILLVGVAFQYRATFPVNIPGSFYRTEWPETLYHLGIVLCAVYVWQWLSKQVPGNLFFDLLRYSSQHITRLYCIQWPLIIWMIPLFGYQEQPLNISIVLLVCTTALTYTLSYLMDVYQI